MPDTPNFPYEQPDMDFDPQPEEILARLEAVEAVAAGAAAAAAAAADAAADAAAEAASASTAIATVTDSLSLLAPKASPTLTGNPTAPTPSPGDSDTSIATTGFVAAAITADTDGWTYEYLAADWTDNTGVASNVFAGFAPVAGVKYEVQCVLLVTTTVSTTAIQLGMNGPAAPTRWGFESSLFSAANTKAFSGLTTVGAFSNSTTTAGNPLPAHVQGRCYWAGAPGAGNVRMQARAGNTAGTVTIYAGSYMRRRALP